METQQILRIPRSDDPESFVLVNVARNGKSQLDLKLVATEGEDPYVGSVKQSRLKSLRAKNYQDSDEEWARILSHVFVPDRKSPASHRDWDKSLEVVATVKEVDDDEKELVITLRKRIDGITQRLGSITLKQDDDQAIQLFEWNGIAVARANELETEISSLTEKYRVAEETIGKLSNQLEDLIQAKNDHDEQLIAKFVQLLNEKKLKIRNQQRLLASAKIDSSKAAELDAVSEIKGHPAGPSRRGKRKAGREEPEESEESDGFDRMSVDAGKPGPTGGIDEAAQLTESDGRSTPEPLEDETPTADEDDEEDQEPQPPPGKKDARDGSNGQKKKTASPPPRRELPFSRRAAARAAGNRSRTSTPSAPEPTTKKNSIQPQSNQEGENEDRDGTGGETDDDEL
ncbi:hypothetical protein FQN54_007690 [Arachnomyces sp. PD_36]|nr:hypothetical protein FQN54_007690 [Arachnomyces sp. PD_36]